MPDCNTPNRIRFGVFHAPVDRQGCEDNHVRDVNPGEGHVR